MTKSLLQWACPPNHKRDSANSIGAFDIFQVFITRKLTERNHIFEIRKDEFGRDAKLVFTNSDDF